MSQDLGPRQARLITALATMRLALSCLGQSARLK
jgi:hypothetical protein